MDKNRWVYTLSGILFHYLNSVSWILTCFLFFNDTIFLKKKVHRLLQVIGYVENKAGEVLLLHWCTSPCIMKVKTTVFDLMITVLLGFEHDFWSLRLVKCKEYIRFSLAMLAWALYCPGRETADISPGRCFHLLHGYGGAKLSICACAELTSQNVCMKKMSWNQMFNH